MKFRWERIAAAVAASAVMSLVSGRSIAAPGDLSVRQKITHAVIQDQKATVQALLDQGADPNAPAAFSSEDSWYLSERPHGDPAPSLFVVACHFQSITGPGIIEMLLKTGANVNIADRNGVTPLMAASELGGAVDMLLQHGASVNVHDRSGKTPLMYAMNNLGFNTAVALLEKGADINAKNADGDTPLILAIRDAAHNPIMLYGEDEAKKEKQAHGDYLQLLQLLIERKADVNLRDKAGQTPLSAATSMHEPDVVKLLKVAGAKR